MINDDRIAELLERWALTGELTEEEKRNLECWLEMEGETRLLENLRAKEQWAVRQSLGLGRPSERDLSSERDQQPARRQKPFVPARFRLVASAAAAVLLLVCGWTAFFQRHPSAIQKRGLGVRTEMVSRVPVDSERSPHQLRLSDGSRVLLASGSSLCFSAAGREKTGVYTLSGEAFFDIAKHHDLPFVIRTSGNFIIRVLGTRFCVDAYPNRQERKVFLFAGKLQVLHGNDSLLVRRGQEVAIRDSNGMMEQRADPGRMQEWTGTNPDFFLKDTPLNEVLQDVANWYGCTVKNPEGIVGVPLTGYLPRSSVVEEVLRNLQRVENGRVYLQLQGHDINLSSKPPR